MIADEASKLWVKAKKSQSDCLMAFKMAAIVDYEFSYSILLQFR